MHFDFLYNVQFLTYFKLFFLDVSSIFSLFSLFLFSGTFQLQTLAYFRPQKCTVYFLKLPAPEFEQ
jgi:hypothetical protein